jgi:hypothetical protein
LTKCALSFYHLVPPAFFALTEKNASLHFFVDLSRHPIYYRYSQLIPIARIVEMACR